MPVVRPGRAPADANSQQTEFAEIEAWSFLGCFATPKLCSSDFGTLNPKP